MNQVFQTFIPSELPLPIVHGLMLTSVAPRPIALASTCDAQGRVNLAPFSQFNVFSTRPPILIFSSSISGRTGETKDTYKNIKETMEVVVNIVEFDMVYQTSFASTEFERGIDEFVKAGFGKIPSEIVKPPRVAESPVHFECKVTEVKEFGNLGGAGNIFICEVLRIHVSQRVLTSEGKIDPLKLNQAGRCGGHYYIALDHSKLFELPQPQGNIGIGIDALRPNIRNSRVLTGNNLGMLALNQTPPTSDEIEQCKQTETYRYLMTFEGEERMLQVHRAAQEMLNNDNSRMALILLYTFDQ